VELNRITRGKTLIVLPTIALRQWQAEIARFTKPGAVTVYCYHGNTRTSDNILQTICSVEVVLTSYKILESEYRRATAGSKIECSVCGKKFYPEKLRVHRKYFCGESSRRTSAQSKTVRKSGPKSKTKAALEEESSSEEESGDEIDQQKKTVRKKISPTQKQTSARSKGGGKKTPYDGPAPKRAKGEAKSNRKEKESKAKGRKETPLKGKGKTKADSRDVSDEDNLPKSKSSESPHLNDLTPLRVTGEETDKETCVEEEKVDGRLLRP
jgi:hypothetical protein